MATTEAALRLSQAKAARHSLLTGKQVVTFTDPSGRRLEYTPASLAELERYIAELEAGASGLPTRSPPFGVCW